VRSNLAAQLLQFGVGLRQTTIRIKSCLLVLFSVVVYVRTVAWSRFNGARRYLNVSLHTTINNNNNNNNKQTNNNNTPIDSSGVGRRLIADFERGILAAAGGATLLLKLIDLQL
jgi:hypothetical protein